LRAASFLPSAPLRAVAMCLLLLGESVGDVPNTVGMRSDDVERRKPLAGGLTTQASTEFRQTLLGTIADNNQDMWQKGRGRISHRKGDAANNRKLTSYQVAEIRRRYVPWVVTCKMLAAEFGVSEHAVQAIVQRRNWADAA
jgi:hypothetical protein